MAIPTPDLLGIYYPSKNLTAPFANAGDIGANNNSTVMSIGAPGLTEPDEFWNGAVGFFVEPSQSALRGICFHVRSWDSSTKLLNLFSPLPVAPITRDVFRIFAGGKCPSNQEVLAMKVSGKQPEVDLVPGTQVTGITIVKTSGMLGEGTLTLQYNATTRSLTLRMVSVEHATTTRGYRGLDFKRLIEHSLQTKPITQENIIGGYWNNDDDEEDVS